MECIAEDRKHISHKPIKIQLELQTRIQEWQLLVESCKKLKKALDDKYHLIKPLVNYLENEDLHKKDLNVNPPSHKVSEDVASFSE